MEIQVKEFSFKMIAVWLCKRGVNDSELMLELNLRFKEWKAAGYLPVVYESGEDNMEEVIKALMRHRIEKQAKTNFERFGDRNGTDEK